MIVPKNLFSMLMIWLLASTVAAAPSLYSIGFTKNQAISSKRGEDASLVGQPDCVHWYCNAHFCWPTPCGSDAAMDDATTNINNKTTLIKSEDSIDLASPPHCVHWHCNGRFCWASPCHSDETATGKLDKKSLNETDTAILLADQPHCVHWYCNAHFCWPIPCDGGVAAEDTESTTKNVDKNSFSESEKDVDSARPPHCVHWHCNGRFCWASPCNGDATINDTKSITSNVSRQL